MDSSSLVDLWYGWTSSQDMKALANMAQQRIQYAKSKSDYVAKLDGTFKIPVYSTSDKAVNAEAAIGDKGTALQQSVFGGAPPTATGVKRTREDEGSDAMEEDEEDMEMDESDDD
jgi:U2 small nuclear ribonucleoprotein B''